MLEHFKNIATKFRIVFEYNPFKAIKIMIQMEKNTPPKKKKKKKKATKTDDRSCIELL